MSLTNSVADIDNYSVELYFAFGPDNKDAAFRSILDPGAARSDLNLYARGNEALQFFPGPIGAANALVEGGFNHLVYTRATSGSIQVYANGVLALTDNTNAVESQVTGNVIHFFEDDGTEAASGEVDYIRLYNGVLSSANAEQQIGRASCRERV